VSISQFDPQLNALEAEMKDVFASREGFLYDLLRYHMGWSSQQGEALDSPPRLHFQSMLTLVCCQAISGDFSAALPAAAGIEFVHNYTLVHGDVQSNRAVSDDRPSVWWVWGPAQAINVGDGLHALGRNTIMRLAQRGIPPERVLPAVTSLDKACLALCEGQYMDLEFQDQLMVTSADYHNMIGRKTGALAGCATELGAIAAGADNDVCAAFQKMGHGLGMAWQISLDIADLWGRGDDGMTSSNMLNKKKSLPLIHALESSPLSDKRALGNIYMKRGLQPEDVSQVMGILNQTGARPFAEARAQELAQEALSGTGLSEEGLKPLRDLTDWALEGHGHD
jgi:geranylgeranyl diphosphate synthase type I